MPKAPHWQNYYKSSKQNTNNGHKQSNVGAASTSPLISTTTTTPSNYHQQQQKQQQHSDGSEMAQPLHRVSSPHPQQHTTATLTTTSGKRPTAATASATKAFAILKQNIHHQQMHHPQQPNSNVQSTHTGKQTSGGRGRGVLGIQQQQYGLADKNNNPLAGARHMPTLSHLAVEEQYYQYHNSSNSSALPLHRHSDRENHVNSGRCVDVTTYVNNVNYEDAPCDTVVAQTSSRPPNGNNKASNERPKKQAEKKAEMFYKYPNEKIETVNKWRMLHYAACDKYEDDYDDYYKKTSVRRVITYDGFDKKNNKREGQSPVHFGLLSQRVERLVPFGEIPCMPDEYLYASIKQENDDLLNNSNNRVPK